MIVYPMLLRETLLRTCKQIPQKGNTAHANATMSSIRFEREPNNLGAWHKPETISNSVMKDMAQKYVVFALSACFTGDMKRENQTKSTVCPIYHIKDPVSIAINSGNTGMKMLKILTSR